MLRLTMTSSSETKKQITDKNVKGAIYYNIIANAPDMVEKAYLWRNVYKFLHEKLKETGVKEPEAKLFRGFTFYSAIPEHAYSKAFELIKNMSQEDKDKLYSSSVENGCWMEDVYMTGQSDEF